MNENESVPHFIAYVSDSYVEADDSLEALIALLLEDGLGDGEDCVIFEDFHHLVAVVLADGSVRRFERPTHPPAQDDVDARLKNVFVTRRRRSRSPVGGTRPPRHGSC
jgi:hypothetical protein